jgi:hypothetical protein
MNSSREEQLFQLALGKPVGERASGSKHYSPLTNPDGALAETAPEARGTKTPTHYLLTSCALPGR